MTSISVDDLRSDARAWLAANRDAAPRDFGPICPPELMEAARGWQRRVHEAGFAGIHWPVEHGGRGLTADHNAAWQLECALAGVPPVLNMVGLVLAGGALLRYGTREQQAVHLRATLAAEHVWCQLFSEPGAGSDLGSLTTRAERDGDRFVVNGQKVWCSGGRASNWGILMARTNRQVAKHQGITFFAIPMDLPGIEIRPLRQMTGEAEFDEVFLTDVELTSNHVLGPIDGGWNVGMAVLTNERGHVGTTVLGLERRLAAMVAMAADRELDAGRRQRLAALYSRGFALKALAERQGPIASTAASLMKLGITEVQFEMSMLRGEIRGASAQLDGAEAAAMLAAPGGRIAGGTSQVQRNLIAERLLGLPREPKP